MSNVEAARKGFTRKERKKMGATFWNVRRILKDLKADGELASDHGVNAISVLDRLAVENEAVFASVGEGRDWDSFLEFLERLIELILKFLPLFL